ncbi:MAG: YkvA family protein [Acidimicrobiales bacterium]
MSLGPAVVAVIAAVAMIALTWTIAVVLAKRLPEGLLKDALTALPAAVTTARRLRRTAAVPRRVKVVLILAGLYLVSPIDLLPEFLPVIGALDDLVVVVLALRYAAAHTPVSAVRAAWPADQALLDRILDRVGRSDHLGRSDHDDRTGD